MTRPWRERLCTLAVPPLFALTGLVSYLHYHRYGLAMPEALAACAVAAAVAALLGLWLAATDNLAIRAVALAAVAAMLAEVHLDWVTGLKLLVEGGHWGRLAAYGAATAGGLALLLALRRNAGAILAAVAAAMLGAAFVGPTAPRPVPVPASAGASLDLPVQLHVVLDAHVGAEAIPRDIPGGTELYENLKAFYVRWGFRLYGRAYSPYFLTFNSIGNLLNGAAEAGHGVWVRRPGDQWVVEHNRRFEQLRAQGYRIRVFQSDYLDVCGHGGAVALCRQYPGYTVGALRGAPLSWAAKAGLLLAHYYTRGAFYTGLHRVYGRLAAPLGLPAWAYRDVDFFSLGAPDELRALAADILRHGRGHAWFAHLLFPHDPFAFDAGCRLRTDPGSWHSRRHDHNHASATGDPESRRAAYRASFAQTRCLMRLFEEIFTEMQAAGLLADAVIVLHGDHGSRIALVDPMAVNIGRFGRRDVVDSFPTLYAIRKPGITPGYDAVQAAIHNLFATQAMRLPPPHDEGTVYLAPDDGRRGAELLARPFRF